MAEPKHRDWIKLWIKESLLGTIREDLTPDERSLWYDFLLLAGNSRIPGIICANEDAPLPIIRIAGILNVPTELVTRGIEKFRKSNRIEVDDKGIIHIVNWDKYQYSEYDRQKPYRVEFETPAWIDKEIWNDYLEMRKKKHSPPTNRGLAMIVTRLKTLMDEGDDPNEVLAQSVMFSWTGVFPLNKGGNGSGKARKHLEAARTGKYTEPPKYSD